MLVSDSRELYEKLLTCKLLENSPKFWWPSYGSFEVVLGAILTQNSQWIKVEKSLENLRDNDLLCVDSVLTCKDELLIESIRPSGMYKNKSKYIKLLAQAICNDFGDFESFTWKVDRQWLLKQKGIGKETADSILCYACKRPVMVVDAYTQRLLSALGYELKTYDELQDWFEIDSALMAAHFHGMIVEYVKNNSQRKSVDLGLLHKT